MMKRTLSILMILAVTSCVGKISSEFVCDGGGDRDVSDR